MSNDDFGGSWWGQRWIEALERLSTAWQNRLPRGRDYAKKGHVISLAVSPGKISARVQGSRSKPYTTTIEVPALRDSDWERVIVSLAAEARFPAQLLAGVMPADIEDAFAAFNVNLFPVRNSELLGSCTCPDKARPCKHIAAVHYAFGQALDRDPFLLFHVRGVDRERLLRGFNRAWFGDAYDESADDRTGARIDNGIAVLPMSADRFNRSPEPIESMSFAPLEGDHSLLILDRLGAPRSWTIPIAIEHLLGPVYEEVTQMARGIAVEGFDESEANGDADSDSGETPATATPYRDLPAASLVRPPSTSEDRPRPSFVMPLSLNMARRPQRVQPTTPEPEADRSRVIVRKGVATVARSRRPGSGSSSRSDAPLAPPAPNRGAAPPRVEPAAPLPTASLDDAAPQAMLQMHVAETSGPAVVRRRAAGAIVVEQPGVVSTKAVKRGAAVGPETPAVNGSAVDDLRAASARWIEDPTEVTFVTLMAAARAADREQETLRREGARLSQRARERGFVLTTPIALMLLCAGEHKLVSDQIFSLGKKAWRDGAPGEAVLLYAGRALLAGAAPPDGSLLALLWRDLERKPHETVDRGLGSIGSWLAEGLRQQPPPPTAVERLVRLCRELATWAISAPGTLGGTGVAARFAVAAAEAVELAGVDGGAGPLLAALHTQAAKKRALISALEAAVAESAVLG